MRAYCKGAASRDTMAEAQELGQGGDPAEDAAEALKVLSLQHSSSTRFAHLCTASSPADFCVILQYFDYIK